MHGYSRSTDILSQAYLNGRMWLVLQVLIIVQTIIHCRSKLFTTGQARVNPVHYVIGCMGG